MTGPRLDTQRQGRRADMGIKWIQVTETSQPAYEIDVGGFYSHFIDTETGPERGTPIFRVYALRYPFKVTF